MTQKPDGGPAYPDPSRAVGPAPTGMSLRDYFAGQALQGLPALCVHDTLQNGVTFEQHIADHAYALADAMIAERDK